MNVLVDGLWQVVVDDVLHAADVEASSGDVRGHDDVHSARAEVGQGQLALSLEPVAVDGSGRKPL